MCGVGHVPCSLAAMNALTSLPSLCPPPLPLPLGRPPLIFRELPLHSKHKDKEKRLELNRGRGETQN